MGEPPSLAALQGPAQRQLVRGPSAVTVKPRTGSGTTADLVDAMGWEVPNRYCVCQGNIR